MTETPRKTYHNTHSSQPPAAVLSGNRDMPCATKATQDLHKLNAVPSRIVYTGDARLGSVDETPVNLRETIANLVKKMASRPSTGGDHSAGSLTAPGVGRNSNSVPVFSSRAPVDCDAGLNPPSDPRPASLFQFMRRILSWPRQSRDRAIQAPEPRADQSHAEQYEEHYDRYCRPVDPSRAEVLLFHRHPLLLATRSPLESLAAIHPLLKPSYFKKAAIDVATLLLLGSLCLLTLAVMLLAALGVVGLPLFDLG